MRGLAQSRASGRLTCMVRSTVYRQPTPPFLQDPGGDVRMAHLRRILQGRLTHCVCVQWESSAVPYHSGERFEESREAQHAGTCPALTVRYAVRTHNPQRWAAEICRTCTPGVALGLREGCSTRRHDVWDSETEYGRCVRCVRVCTDRERRCSRTTALTNAPR